MGVDTHLYLSTRWDIRDIVRVIERTQSTKVEIKSHHDFAPGYFTLSFKDRMLNLHTNTQTPIGTATLLSFRANEEAHNIFKGIAEVLGGVFEESDSVGTCEFIQGSMWEENALAYHLKYAILEEGIDPDDIGALKESIEAWNKQYKS